MSDEITAADAGAAVAALENEAAEAVEAAQAAEAAASAAIAAAEVVEAAAIAQAATEVREVVAAVENAEGDLSWLKMQIAELRAKTETLEALMREAMALMRGSGSVPVVAEPPPVVVSEPSTPQTPSIGPAEVGHQEGEAPPPARSKNKKYRRI